LYAPGVLDLPVSRGRRGAFEPPAAILIESFAATEARAGG
jgi:hypothetical protein